MLYLFDMDGTLISGYLDRADKDFNAWEVLPGRRECLASLLDAGHQLGIVTNQGGVAFGYVSQSEAEVKIAAALHALGLPPETPVAVCYADSRSRDPRYNDPAACARRKPSGAMIRELAEQAGMTAEEIVFVGDRPEDEAAARDAGVVFMHANLFFGDPSGAEVGTLEQKLRSGPGSALLSALTEQQDIYSAQQEVDRRVDARIIERDADGYRVAVRVDGGQWQVDPWWYEV